jgi:hypothetical protein
MERVDGCSTINTIFSHLVKWQLHCAYQSSRGLTQGDPLSPLLFVIAIYPLQKILDLATEGHFAKFRGKQTVMHTSMYVDHTTIFSKPYKKDVTALADILAKFIKVLGLQTNVLKSSVIPIRCQGVDLDEVLRDFPARRALHDKISRAASNKHQIAKG